MIVISFLISVLTGIVASLFGVGGGVLAIPVMVLLLGLSPPEAVATNSVIIIVSTLLSAFFHWRQGTLRKEGVWIGVGGVLGTLLGNALFLYISKVGAMKTVLGISFILIGILMMLDITKRSQTKSFTAKSLAVIGFFGGTFAALVGMSGGVLLNPILVLLGVDIKYAIGMSVTALPLITVASAIPKVLAGYAKLDVAAVWIPGLIIGTKIGARLMKTMKSKTLKRAFGIFMILIGIKLLL
ncbi:sulfite exporter TauE/SafE family protein [Ignicoccus hospitalis]|uniref:Probable membrane transporter protein n=1 Tax=Ignicoccus hospitalis (strain KIN4/I / DSM 18386 / JCM 14125) TaxID=453591 RepID=A8A8K1_IGNH4|nr:sulfite exporter TauE/SafE family protein [Ignicoccus hospitalis]ABU81253.1 protein of unknown function DUF81 [Ignicoccus hospitalis KIN4/I]HIH90935.1 sulfite exporter TauE/SafE family protein [Desulfurococcaceae archaeon]